MLTAPLTPAATQGQCSTDVMTLATTAQSVVPTTKTYGQYQDSLAVRPQPGHLVTLQVIDHAGEVRLPAGGHGDVVDGVDELRGGGECYECDQVVLQR